MLPNFPHIINYKHFSLLIFLFHNLNDFCNFNKIKDSLKMMRMD